MPSKPRRKSATETGISAAGVRQIILALPDVEESRSYGMPAFKVNGRFLARFRDDDELLVVRLAAIADRDVLMQLNPRAFFFTEHYRDYPAVLIRLADVPVALLRDVMAESCAHVAAKPRRPASAAKKSRRSTRPGAAGKARRPSPQ